MVNNIALIGFMGTGKSVVGRSLAHRLGWYFLELDEKIEEMAGKSITDIFHENGEEYFRELESSVLKGIRDCEDTVISCGGGVVLDPGNVKLLRRHSTVVLLTATPEVIAERIIDDDCRPLLKEENKLKRIEDMMGQRRDTYRGCAEYTIDTSGLEVDEVVNRIIEEVNP